MRPKTQLKRELMDTAAIRLIGHHVGRPMAEPYRSTIISLTRLMLHTMTQSQALVFYQKYPALRPPEDCEDIEAFLERLYPEAQQLALFPIEARSA